MKKFLLYILLLVLVLSLCGCGKNSVGKMRIQPANLSKDAEDIAHLLDDNTLFFDYRVDKSIHSVSFNFWKYENGEWISFGQSAGKLNGTQGRIGVRMNGNGYDLFHIEESASDEIHFDLVEDFAEAPAVLGSRITEPIAIQDGAEIELWSKIGVDINTTLRAFSDFRSAECNSGVAVTVTFSSEIAE